MNAPVKNLQEQGRDRLAPARVRAHLQHRLRSALGPAALRAEVPADVAPIPRQYWQQAMGAPLQDFLGRSSKMIRAGLTEWAWNAAGGQEQLPMAFPLHNSKSMLVTTHTVCSPI